MGRNKQLRKRIAGQLRVIAGHERKIEIEMRQPAPDMDYVRKWKSDIDIARSNMRKLQKKLE